MLSGAHVQNPGMDPQHCVRPDVVGHSPAWGWRQKNQPSKMTLDCSQETGKWEERGGPCWSWASSGQWFYSTPWENPCIQFFKMDIQKTQQIASDHVRGATGGNRVSCTAHQEASHWWVKLRETKPRPATPCHATPRPPTTLAPEHVCCCHFSLLSSRVWMGVVGEDSHCL